MGLMYINGLCVSDTFQKNMSNNVRKQHIGNLPVGFWRETAVCRSWSFSRWYRPRTGLVWLRSHRTRDYSRCARPSYLSNSTNKKCLSALCRTTKCRTSYFLLSCDWNPAFWLGWAAFFSKRWRLFLLKCSDGVVICKKFLRDLF